MFATKSKVFPLAVHPQVLPITEGKRSDFQREDGQLRPLTVEQHQVTVQHPVKDGKGMSLDSFFQMAKEAGEGLGKEMWKMLTSTVQEAAQETGNELKIKKGALTQDDLLHMLESVHHNFDEAGNPTGQFFGGSEFLQEIKSHEKEWSEDKEFQRKVSELKKRKRAEFDEREARRRLVS